jgi:hypothetical protein
MSKLRLKAVAVVLLRLLNSRLPEKSGSRFTWGSAAHMKEDILEQLVDEYLQHQGYFTRHNIRFKPEVDHPEYIQRMDAVASDIDVIGIHPTLQGPARVMVVSCKSWQDGFRPENWISLIQAQHLAGAYAGQEEEDEIEAVVSLLKTILLLRPMR